MNSPTTPTELADAIEALVASYIDSVRETARQAVERVLSQPAAPRQASKAAKAKPTKAKRTAATAPRSTTARRTPAELDQVGDALCELVRAHPGASMAELAERMETSVRMLERPMAKLKAAGRVRTVGQWHLMRYYPAVVRAAESGA
jgi:ribosome-binding protein aMBF1 (putative translation factor)